MSWGAPSHLHLYLCTDTCFFQPAWSLRSILERAWSSEAAVEKQKWSECWARWRCRALWHWVVRVVLCRWDRWQRIYSHRIPRLNAKQQNQSPFGWYNDLLGSPFFCDQMRSFVLEIFLMLYGMHASRWNRTIICCIVVYVYGTLLFSF